MDPGAAPAELALKIAVQRDIQIVEETPRTSIGTVDHANDVGGICGLQLPDPLISHDARRFVIGSGECGCR